MQTINELAKELNLTPEQSAKIQQYVNELVVELLESIKFDNDRNFDETINDLKNVQ
jgi:DNA-directed RNA polymerase sigma subunit (sigma70/sigma32)